jgi:hypothetical protein
MRNLFSKLLSYSPRPGRTPREDFTTELVVSMLQADERLKEIVVELLVSKFTTMEPGRIIAVPDAANWSVETQRSLPSRKRPDITFLDQEHRVKMYVEHKIDSAPDFQQLESYAEDIRAQQGLGLVLLTKYWDLAPEHVAKLKSICQFYVLRWRELFHVLRDEIKRRQALDSSKVSLLHDEFLAFLQEERMSEKIVFSPEDLFVVRRIHSVLSLMDAVFNVGNLEGVFGGLVKSGKYSDYTTRSTQSQKYGRYVVYGTIPNESAYVGLLMGFYFHGDYRYLYRGNEGFEDYPLIYISIEADPTKRIFHSIRDRAKVAFTSLSEWKVVEDSQGAWDAVVRVRPLNDLRSGNHVEEVAHWFADGLRQLEDSGFCKEIGTLA